MVPEHVARTLAGQIVTELHRLGAVVRECTVQCDHESVVVMADVNGRSVLCQAFANQPIAYREVAIELLGASVDPLAPREVSLN